MASFELSYDSEDDVLEVSFETFDDRFCRTIELNDHILLFTDLGGTMVWALTLYSFGQLLRVNETQFTGLADAPEDEIRRVWALLAKPPARHFLEVTDPDNLVARVLTPSLASLIDLY